MKLSKSERKKQFQLFSMVLNELEAVVLRKNKQFRLFSMVLNELEDVVICFYFL